LPRLQNLNPYHYPVSKRMRTEAAAGECPLVEQRQLADAHPRDKDRLLPLVRWAVGLGGW